MSKILKLLSLSILCVACQNKINCNLDSDILKANDSILLSLKSDTLLTQFLNKMEEPILESHNGETYRFMILGPWGHNQICKLNKTSDNITLSSKRYWKEHNDIEIDSLGQEITKIIKEDDWRKIKNSLDELNFWNLPVRIDDNHYLDGTGYIIEGFSSIKNECTKRNYHATARISPPDTTLYKAVFEEIIDLTLE